MFPLLLSSAVSVGDLPLLQPCKYYNTYNYSCVDKEFDGGSASAPNGEIGRRFTFFDLQNKRSVTSSDSYYSKLNDSFQRCSSNTEDDVACNFLASSCALAGFYPNTPSCQKLALLFPNYNSTFGGYEYWPNSQPFVQYATEAKNALNEKTLTSDISKSVLNFQLARFSNDGKFKGFTKMTDQFIRCTNNKEGSGFWRLFGTYFKSECLFDLKAFADTAGTDIFDPFVLDGSEKDGILRPVPIKLLTYRDENDAAVNLGKIEKKQRVFRRFFMFDNYTNNIFIQYLSKLTIHFDSEGDSNLPKTPYFEISYSSVRREELFSANQSLVFTTESIANPLYTFETVYNRDMNYIFNAASITAIVLGALSLVFWLYRTNIIVRRYGEDGIDFYVLFGAITEFLSIGAYYLFLLAFLFTFVVFCSFKWSGAFTSISGDFSFLYPIIWLSFACSIVSLALKILMQFSADVFFIDWEPRRPSTPVSAWRKILIGNQWVKLVSSRSYNVCFTLIVLLFILKGFDVTNISTGAPTNKLIYSGEFIPVLRFGFVSFLYIILLLAEWVFFLIKDTIFGSKFDDFITLCYTANISVLTMISRSWGYYVHGRAGSPVDEGHGKLIESVGTEEITKQLNIKEFSNTKKNVYEVFLAPDFRDPLSQAYERIVNSVYHKPRNLRESNVSSVAPSAIASYEQLNVFMQRFFGAEEKSREFDIIPSPVTYTMFRIPPTPQERSILYAESNYSLRTAFFGRSEWLFALVDLLFFCGVDYQTNNTPVAAFVTIVCDAVLMTIFRSFVRKNVAHKSLLDDRFLVE